MFSISNMSLIILIVYNNIMIIIKAIIRIVSYPAPPIHTWGRETV